MNEILPVREGRERKSPLRQIGLLWQMLRSYQRGRFNYERWLDPKRPITDTLEHTLYAQSLAYKTSRIFTAKGYSQYDFGGPVAISDAISEESNHLFISGSSFRGMFDNSDCRWTDQKGRMIGVVDTELVELESQTRSLPTDIRSLTQDRIIARYLLLRKALFGTLDEAEPYLREVRIIEANPRVLNTLVSAAVAREALGDALLFYNPNYNENALNSPRHISGHKLAVRRELAERLPYLDRIKVPPMPNSSQFSEFEALP